MTVRVEHIMGTAVRFDAEGRAPRRAAIDSAVAYLRWVEQVFSVHLPDSQISMIASAELLPENAAPVVTRVLDRCRALRILTNGWFDHRRRRNAIDHDFTGVGGLQQSVIGHGQFENQVFAAAIGDFRREKGRLDRTGRRQRDGRTGGLFPGKGRIGIDVVVGVVGPGAVKGHLVAGCHRLVGAGMGYGRLIEVGHVNDASIGGLQSAFIGNRQFERQ